MTRALMLQGTGSDVGKSLLVAGLARVFTRRGLKVRPFKPQNMSNNAAVTAEGGEIGRAQALQARACGAPPAIDMNPVLLKPQTDGMAQLIVCGRVHSALSARDYRALAPSLLPQVLAAFHRLAASADLILVEGAGSPAEINLRPGDIANMGFAEAADVPVALIGDIERGGLSRSSSVRTRCCRRASVPASSAISSTSSAATSGCSTAASRRSASAPASPALGSCRISRTLAFSRRKTRWRWPLTPALSPQAGRGSPACSGGRVRGIASRSPCRSCRASPISMISIRCAPNPVSTSSSCARGSRCRATWRS